MDLWRFCFVQNFLLLMCALSLLILFCFSIVESEEIFCSDCNVGVRRWGLISEINLSCLKSCFLPLGPPDISCRLGRAQYEERNLP